VQTPEPQSVAWRQAAPSAQMGEHAARQVPAVQTPEVQSPGAPHKAPVAHVGEQAGGAHNDEVHR